ncbi:hypothetical protein ACQJBY_061882 [Aegilops geniculata]
MATAGVVILSLLLIVLSLASADVFCDNVKAIAATLSKNISSSPVHFATTSFGLAPDVVYALAFCRGDVVSDSACGQCVTNRFDMLLKLTPPPQQQCFNGYVFYGECIVIYSYKEDDILWPADWWNTTDYNTTAEWWNVKNITVDVPVITGLIRELLVKTIEKVVVTVKPRWYATGIMDSRTAFPLVYSSAQCTPDLSAGDCLACLHRLLATVNSTMSLRIGGQIYFKRCYFRYESSSFYKGIPMLNVSAPSPVLTLSPTQHKRPMSMLWAIPIVVLPLAAAAFLSFICYSRRLTRQRKGSRHALNFEGHDQLVWGAKNSEFSFFDFEQLLKATNNFSEEYKLGRGGFGTVYKGKLPGGLEIAVKRLASNSGQGFIEFNNEVQLIARLQHRNLVRLLGCCAQQEEKILVYEYLTNKSLDFYIFDENRRALLDWSRLVAIIEGVAHGLLYLHKHSRLLVIHRDLKPSNILLDNEMNPKISDFGLARILSSKGNTTRRVVGTYGYMAPEYASEGIFSIKSDVFSFGVVIFEILSGTRNSSRRQCGDYINLLGHAWHLWEEGRWIDLVNASLSRENHSIKIMRCINIALLCVQENAADRPSMVDIVAMLSNDTMIMAKPNKPAHFNVRLADAEASTTPVACSINYLTLSTIIPR